MLIDLLLQQPILACLLLIRLLLHAVMEYKPLKIVACTYQAISGAGKTFKGWPEMIDSVIPHIGGEEEKSEQERLKAEGYIQKLSSA